MTKAEAREQMKYLRQNLPADQRLIRERKMRERLFSMEEMKRADWVYPFVSCGTEIDTIEIIRRIFREGISRIAVPRVSGKQMKFYEIHTLNDLKPGYMGISEPVTTMEVAADRGIMLMPGLAFDYSRNRVGYGAGFYDRYMQQYGTSGLKTIGVAFEFQVVPQIEAEAHDRKPDCIVTDQNIID